MHSILLVEDTKQFQVLVTTLLSPLKVTVTDDPDKVRDFLMKERFDLILLDISLPKRDGFSVLQELQADPEFSSIPVIFLTSKDQVTDKVTAFSLGADDYIQKPFNALEFRARVHAKLQKVRRTLEKENVMILGDIRIDLASHRVTLGTNGNEIVLTQTEFKLLQYMGKHPGQVYSREQLLQSVWGDEGAVFDRSIDVHISSLRKKFAQSQITFKAVPTVGYKILLNSESSKKAS